MISGLYIFSFSILSKNLIKISLLVFRVLLLGFTCFGHYNRTHSDPPNSHQKFYNPPDFIPLGKLINKTYLHSIHILTDKNNFTLVLYVKILVKRVYKTKYPLCSF